MVEMVVVEVVTVGVRSSGGEELMKSTMNWSMGEMGCSVVGVEVVGGLQVVDVEEG